MTISYNPLTNPWVALGLILGVALILPSEAWAEQIEATSLDIVKDIIPKFTGTVTTGLKWGSAIGGVVLFAVGLSKHSMKVAGYGLGLAAVPSTILETMKVGAALLLD